MCIRDSPYGCSYADLFKGGLTIYTSLDPELQDAAQAAVDNQRANMADNLDASIAVSYPHLDVYKRQSHEYTVFTGASTICAISGAV